ncbi:MAG: hypothetical protein CBD27_10010 [Rhodospirillaceae bacterium TMED167]|nr:hypothetical protein [Rhodospirillaceae bacterium]OUW25021.1 MAG: hypothetical protein CBD27_10010 [Rhodospirillaceae bacterium TMED167]
MVLDVLVSNLGPVNLAALLAIAFIGLPHGAADGAIAGHLGYTSRLSSTLKFFSAYSALAALVVLFWLVFPTIALMGFLAISIIHFGLDAARIEKGVLRWLQVFAHGCAIIVGISQSHKEEVHHIYTFLIGNDVAPVWIMIDLLSSLFIVVLVVYVWQAIIDPGWRLSFIELMVLMVIFSQLPPLASFALYFCGLHSVRHFQSVWRSLRLSLPLRTICLQIAGVTILSWALGVLMIWIGMVHATADVILIRVIFIGLAALTVPHMILVDVLYRGRSHAPLVPDKRT